MSLRFLEDQYIILQKQKFSYDFAKNLHRCCTFIYLYFAGRPHIPHFRVYMFHAYSVTWLLPSPDDKLSPSIRIQWNPF